MSSSKSPVRERTGPTPTEGAQSNGHDLIAIAAWIPGRPPTDAAIELTDGHEYETRYWRCRACGQERNRRDEFTDPCAAERPQSPVMDGGYSVDDDRTRRALSEDMTVHFVERGPIYRVDSESGRSYLVDVEAETCTCPDHERRAVFCKHQRRVDLEIRAGQIPGPDGRFVR